MRAWFKQILDRLPYIGWLRKQVRNQGNVPAGHYHSPIPHPNDIRRFLASPPDRPADLPEIDLNPDGQFETLQAYLPYYPGLPWVEQTDPGLRYVFPNEWFGLADAIFLHCFLQATQPRRIVEVGCGYSSAVLLDSVESAFPERPAITLIDPQPDRLLRLLKPGDQGAIRIVSARVQDSPREPFSSLAAGDLLLIDSSHVVKLGSDLQYLMFDILPSLPAGVNVHFHDIFYPFEYPGEWIARGTYLNEDYFLRAFLAYNRSWEITFFADFARSAFKDFLQAEMPLCLADRGSSLCLRRKENHPDVQGRRNDATAVHHS